MLKHIYRGIILVVIFVVSVMFMGNNIKEEKSESNATTTMAATTFPVMYIQTEQGLINPLHGFSTNIDAKLIRENITLIDTDQSVVVSIDQKKTIVKKLNYEVRDGATSDLIEQGTISALTEEHGNKTAKIKIKETLDENKEYVMKITSVTSTGKKIHFYTRVKKVLNAHLSEKQSFVTMIHNAIINKDDNAGISLYLEPKATMDNTSYSHVTINSSYDMVMWGKLNPEVITDIQTRITEINQDTASFELNYKVKVETGTGKEEFTVSEFFRVKYTPSRMYLLYYERNTEADFNPAYISIKKGEIKLGISNEYNLPYLTDASETKLAFVKNKCLWYYDMIANSMVEVFTFEQKKSDFIRDSYAKHDIKLLNMDEDGNIDFVVYGYMNRGEYEGRTAVILYHFSSMDNRIVENVYIPMNIPYDVMKEDLSGFGYVTKANVFYFSLQDKIFAYNMITKKLETVVEDAKPSNIMISQKDAYIAWTDSSELGKASTITLLDLETGAKTTINAKAKEGLCILGKIDENIIIGYVKNKDISKTDDGSILAPAYKVSIVNKKRDELKSYKNKNNYTVSVQVNDNVIQLNRVKKSKSSDTGYVATDIDHILNHSQEDNSKIMITTRVTDKTLTELYLTIPSTIELTKKPTVKTTVNTVIKEDKTLRLDIKASNRERYYVFAVGEVVNVFDKPGDAIALADQKMGCVINQDFKVIWERGNRQTRMNLSGITPVYSNSGLNSKKACAKMLLDNSGVNVTPSQIADKNSSVMDILTKNMKKEPINLTGSTLEQVLYYVSHGKAVMAMKNDHQAVLIVGYDEFNVTMIDPELNKTWKEGYKDSSKLFTNAGNVFISFLD